ncbi:MAG: hypothetical protein ACRDIU_10050 [Actinomycetota bacterium]
MIWVAPLQPTEASDTYTIHVEYSLGSRPKITVQSPELRRPAGKPLPHPFEGDELCLHYAEEFSGQDLISSTIVPWISEWLLYYELWLITGKWLGGGHGDESDARKE